MSEKLTRRAPAAGFTLIELMVVVAIITVITTLAVSATKTSAKPIDAASRFANLVGEASRVAVRGGPVRADVAVDEGSTRRTRIVGTVGSSPTGATIGFTIEVLVEDPVASTPRWDEVSSMTVPGSVTADDFALTVGDHASVTLQSDWSTFVVSCFPNGSCSAASLFFSSPAAHARVSVLPLGTATYVRKDWN